jgi:hypothetical protein
MAAPGGRPADAGRRVSPPCKPPASRRCAGRLPRPGRRIHGPGRWWPKATRLPIQGRPARGRAGCLRWPQPPRQPERQLRRHSGRRRTGRPHQPPAHLADSIPRRRAADEHKTARNPAAGKGGMVRLSSVCGHGDPRQMTTRPAAMCARRRAARHSRKRRRAPVHTGATERSLWVTAPGEGERPGVAPNGGSASVLPCVLRHLV